jgi:hypothetical protein
VLRHEISRGPVRFAFTGRSGGVSAAPYDTLNLGGHVGDSPTAVAANRARLAGSVGLPADHVLYLNQVHGADVAVADAPWRGPAPFADAMVTARTDLALAVLVADCVPVLLADPGAGVLGVAHAGRPGLAAGVVPAVVAAMRSAGAREVSAVVGPSVCGRCYEVPTEMRAEVSSVVPEAWSETSWRTPALDLPRGVLAQLRAAGVDAVDVAACTRENPDLFSYRRDGVTGRQAGVVWHPGG